MVGWSGEKKWGIDGIDLFVVHWFWYFFFFFFFWKIHPCGGGNKFCFHFSLFNHKPMINNHINLYSCDFITPPEPSSLIQLIICLIIINKFYIFIYTNRNQIEMNYEITRIYKIFPITQIKQQKNGKKHKENKSTKSTSISLLF